MNHPAASWSLVMVLMAGFLGGARTSLAGDCEPHFEAIGANELPSWVRAVEAMDSGDGIRIYAGSESYGANSLMRFDGKVWEPVASGMNGWGVYSLRTYTTPVGPKLAVGGYFTAVAGFSSANLATWNGNAWSASGAPYIVVALEVADLGTGSQLFSGGSWQGSGGVTFGGGTDKNVMALQAFNDGSGEKLFVAGDFTVAGSLPVSSIAAWTGTSWEPLGSGVAGVIRSMTVFDDRSGAGPRLIVGGEFASAGGMPAANIASWDGQKWRALGSGIAGSVLAMTPFDDGSGAARLYVTGTFSSAGGVESTGLACWDGEQWSPSGPLAGWYGGTSLKVVNDGSDSAPTLLVGGSFTSAGGVPAKYLARLVGCAAEYLLVPSEFPTIGAACEAASDGDFVVVSPGVYRERVNLGAKAISVVASAEAGEVVVVGDGLPGSLLVVTGGQKPTSRIRGLTFRGGVSGSSVPGISDLTLGGAAVIVGSSPTIQDCIFEQNQAGLGGAVFVSDSAAAFRYCEFRENSATMGGAVLATGASIRMEDCRIENNTAGVSGGGLYLDITPVSHGDTVLLRTEVASCTAPNGGAITCHSSVPELKLRVLQSSLVQNLAVAGAAGACWVEPTLENVLVLGGSEICKNSSPQLVSGSIIDLGENTICPCDADLNVDGIIDGQDLAILLAFWGPSGLFPAADIDASGSVDGADLAVLLSGWGRCS